MHCPPTDHMMPWPVRLMAVTLVGFVSACTSPPAVSPLLEVTEQALRTEASAIEADGKRDAEMVRNSRQSLKDAYHADLEDRARRDEPLSAQWVGDATAVYVQARERLLGHEMILAKQRQRRQANLLDAAAAQHRAIELLERQDQLLTDTLRIDLWQLLQP